MDKIKELTEKLLHEGVEKGQAEAERIIAEAQKKAAAIVENARAEAARIIADGEKQSVELNTNTINELKLYTEQAMNALKSQVANAVSDKLVGESVGKLVGDADFLKKFTVALAGKWVENEPITITAKDADALRDYFAKEAKELLDKGVKIEAFKGNGSNAASLFTVSPINGAYRIDFGKEEFENYFKSFLRPQLIEMIF